jgi:hypothetical protein
LEQEVINRESRASGYRARKTKRKESWKDGERAKKKQKTAAAAAAAADEDEDEDENEKWDEDTPDVLFNEAVRYSVVNSYASAITDCTRGSNCKRQQTTRSRRCEARNSRRF